MGEDKQENGVSQKFVYGIMAGVLITGAINNIALKQQDTFHVTATEDWNHPFLQVVIMFIAEFLCFIAFYVLMRFNAGFKVNYSEQLAIAEKNGLRTDVPFIIPYIPATCDIIGSSLQFLGLTLINQSIYVMLRGGIPVVTAFLSVVFLGRKLYSHHYLGLALAVSGITIVGVSQFLDQTEENSSNMILGLILVLASLITTGIQFIVEEKILNTFYILPLKMVGMEGVWGLALSGAALLCASYVPCNYATNSAGCQPNNYVENVGSGVSVIFENGSMFAYVFLGICSLSFFNFCGVSVTKYVSSLARSILNISVTVIIWVYDLVFIGEPFSWLQLIGFLVLVSGNLIYQEIIEIPGMNHNTKKNMARLSLVKDSQDDERLEKSVEPNETSS